MTAWLHRKFHPACALTVGFIKVFLVLRWTKFRTSRQSSIWSLVDSTSSQVYLDVYTCLPTKRLRFARFARKNVAACLCIGHVNHHFLYALCTLAVLCQLAKGTTFFLSPRAIEALVVELESGMQESDQTHARSCFIIRVSRCTYRDSDLKSKICEVSPSTSLLGIGLRMQGRLGTTRKKLSACDHTPLLGK